MGWSFWSIYDGHVGPQTASVLESLLLGNLAQALSALYRDGKLPETESIHSTFKRVFLALDDEMVVKPAQLIFELPEGAPIKTLAAVALQAARAGSCALVSFYEANVRRLHVAVVGDSRAVLGRRRETADGKTVYDVHVLSVDQTGRNPAEAARLAAAHPDEALVTGSRVLGWGISRSFGNGVMKWSRELQTTMQERVLGDKPRTTLLTPPYFTAEPEMTTTAIEPGDFMVMGSDGLWDCLSNEEVVGLVGVWLARRDRDRDAGGAPSIIGEEEVMKRADSEEVIERVDLPVELKDNKTHYATWNVKKRFVNVDTNAAAHLARNALGGADTDLHHALLTLPAPRARYFRDDLSAIVVFFE
ncbi:phosphatase 2C-like domain-containing protein [Mycena rosella]|uniref:Phosphatase 2C-like domain-containing protein n=1 Tax=Mycena rosella TaxID=1033263 RepID=A0AAD7FC45_MYCRO|nr:phosphatase 2C-like domain-containing protein [Mycena rosella]